MTNEALRHAGFVGEREPVATNPPGLQVVGFDDQKTAAFYIPALTTVNIPRHELGKRAAQELMERFGGRDSAHEIVLPTRLIIRESTAEPRAGMSAR